MLKAQLESVIDDGIIGLLAELAQAELTEVVELTEKIDDLAKRLERRVREAAPTLLAMPGVGPLTAAKIVGETAGNRQVHLRGRVRPLLRDRADPSLVRPHRRPGPADPLRLTRSGNRQLNAAVHRIALTQIRLDGLGQAYYRKKNAQGMTYYEAMRCLKRRLVRVVFGHLRTDQHVATPYLQAAA